MNTLTPFQTHAIETLARICGRNIDAFPALDKIRLYETLAILLPDDSGIAASQAAYMLSKAEEHQLKFHTLLNSANPHPPTAKT